MYERLPMFTRIGEAAIKKDLHNTRALCAALGHPQRKFPSVHIAGTNGKGSVSHMLASVLQAAGYKTGLYTSPHLKDFRERIRINGKPVEEQFVVDFIAQQKTLIEQIQPSFFELTVAMCFDYFAKQEVEIAIIETGLGGRLDSTNIIEPVISVITQIGYDHMQLLGDTLPAIAAEKAGIIKQNTPVVIGESHAETMPVFRKKAADCNANLIESTGMYKILSAEQGDFLTVRVQDQHNKIVSYELDLQGHYQRQNLQTVLSTIDCLKKDGWNISDEALKNGLKQVQVSTGLMGRWQVLRKNPSVILDVAHNPDGIRQVFLQLAGMQYKKLHLIIGMVKDKDVDTVLSLLPKEAIYYFTKAQLPRAMNEEELRKSALKYDLRGNAFIHVNDALDSALNGASSNDLILVCGSVFVVGEVDLIKYTS